MFKLLSVVNQKISMNPVYRFINIRLNNRTLSQSVCSKKKEAIAKKMFGSYFNTREEEEKNSFP